MSEDERRNFIMSDFSINEALDKDCSPMKETYACPNDCYCKDLFARSTAKSILRYSIMRCCYLLNFMMFLINHRNFREKIWYDQANDRESSLTVRKNNFLSLLKQFPKSADGHILYEINGKSVCKSFFKVLTPIYKFDVKIKLTFCTYIFKSASGIPSKAFDSAVACASGKDTNQGVKIFKGAQHKKSCPTWESQSKALRFTLAFLDAYFKGETL